MSEINLERAKVEAFLAAPQFIRSFEVAAVYQRLLKENRGKPEHWQLIRKRMHERFEPHDQSEGDEQKRKVFEELRQMRHQLLTWCENGELTKEKMAELFAGCSLADKFLESYNPKPGSRSETGNVLINDTVEYSGGREKDDYVNINIVPAATRTSAELIERIVDGFHKLAQELKNGQLRHVKKVVMTSWLLGPAFEDKIRALLGEDITIEDSDENDGVIEQVQSLALSYNKRSVEEFLSTGKLPVVRTLKLTKEDFISKFLHS